MSKLHLEVGNITWSSVFPLALYMSQSAPAVCLDKIISNHFSDPLEVYPGSCSSAAVFLLRPLTAEVVFSLVRTETEKSNVNKSQD